MRYQPRVAKGEPTGGQWRVKVLEESGITLAETDVDPWARDDDRLTQTEPECTSGFEAGRIREQASRISQAIDGDEQAQSWVVDTYGSQLQAVQAIGEELAKEADRRAGIDTESLSDLYDDKIRQADHDVDEAKRQAEGSWDSGVAAAKAHLYQLKNGYDDESMQTCRKLADAYHDTLKEVRDMGGIFNTDKATKKDARDAFSEAAELYPSDWLVASNKQAMPIAKTSRRRAHYSGARWYKTKKRAPRIALISPHSNFDWNSPEYQRIGVDEDGLIQAQLCETFTNWYSPEERPKGRGWQRWQGSDGRGVWRRPMYEMKTVSSGIRPEITTNATVPKVDGASSTLATSVHELAHRFEHTVDGMRHLEQDYHARRTAGQELQPLATGRGEVGRPGDYVHAYMGREYPGGYREIMSCGTEALFGGSYGALVGIGDDKADPDMRCFVLGMLACLGRSD